MAYSQVSLGGLTTQISSLLDDVNARYWTALEIQYAIWEGLRVWGALTSFWRTRGSFTLQPANGGLWSAATFPWLPSVFPWQYTSSFPWYDLSAQLPALRSRTVTLNQITQEIQFMLLEAPNGISGAGMSGQVSVTSILNAVRRARNRFVLDAHLPLSIHAILASPPPTQGTVQFEQNAVFVHRASWQDIPGSTWNNLWREDAWSVDHGNPDWTLEPSSPLQYSESELAPLQLQLSPIPVNEGILEALTVDSVQLDLTSPTTNMLVPDEWAHAIKYAALADLLSAESQLVDPMRAQYAEQRYQQAIAFAADARSILRLTVNNVPIPLDSLAALDAGQPYWRNQTGPPQAVATLYDLFTCSPGTVDQPYGAAVDVVQSAPIPKLATDEIQLGLEDIDHLVQYVTHILTFKCGGKDFSMAGYDDFMGAVASRKGVNRAKIRYLGPLFAQAQREWAARPDRVTANA